MIDIIIPAYNSHNTIEQTLFSIAYQDMAKDVNVYIVDDCSKKSYNEIVKFFSNFINIKELKLLIIIWLKIWENLQKKISHGKSKWNLY